MSADPSHPRRILLTRSEEDNALWAERLRQEGFEPIELACIASAPIPEAAAALERELPRADWLAFTSRRGVDAFVALHGAELPGDLRLACVGGATARRAAKRLGAVDLVAPEATAASLGRELAQHAVHAPLRVLAATAEETGGELERALGSASIELARVAVYRTAPAPERKPRLALEADAVFFASPSAARGFLARSSLPEGALVVSLGPTTSAALRALGLRVDAEARARELSSMIEALRGAAAERESRR